MNTEELLRHVSSFRFGKLVLWNGGDYWLILNGQKARSRPPAYSKLKGRWISSDFEGNFPSVCRFPDFDEALRLIERFVSGELK